MQFSPSIQTSALPKGPPESELYSIALPLSFHSGEYRSSPGSPPSEGVFLRPALCVDAFGTVLTAAWQSQAVYLSIAHTHIAVCFEQHQALLTILVIS